MPALPTDLELALLIESRDIRQHIRESLARMRQSAETFRITQEQSVESTALIEQGRATPGRLTPMDLIALPTFGS